MRRTKIVAVLVPVMVVTSLVGAFTASAVTGERLVTVGANLSGYSEVPAISTAGTGTFTAEVVSPFDMIEYELSYSGMSSTVSAAHIHFGQAGVNGGVVAFLCGGGGKPACPETAGSVSGTITAADILAVPSQGIDAGELNEVLMAMGRGLTYANVHSSNFPGGEIRGQISRTG